MTAASFQPPPTMPESLRLPAASALMLLGVLICTSNAWSFFISRRSGRFRSPIPFVGALFLGAGLFVLPATRPFCWAALIVDWGTLEAFRVLPRIVRELRATRAGNLEAEYQAAAGNTRVILRLYRSGVFILRLEIKRPPGELGLTGCGATGPWRREGPRLFLKSESEAGTLELAADPASGELRSSAGFSSWESNPATSLSRFTFVPVNRVR